MSLFPNIIFDNNTDYANVLSVVNDMYSYLQYSGCSCCNSKTLLGVLVQVDGFLTGLGEEDTAEYRSAIKSSYLVLKEKTDC